jgi:hypothetical protein
VIGTACRGHRVIDDGTGWKYDDGHPFDDSRPCATCKVMHEEDGPDPCLGWLPGVDFACCGHGDPSYEYVKVKDKIYNSVEAWREAVEG